MKKVKLFIDESRTTPNGFIRIHSYDEFIKYITKNRLPDFISFNNEEENKLGIDCAKWLIEYCLNYWLPLPEFSVHTEHSNEENSVKSILMNYKKKYKQTFKAEFLTKELELETIRMQKRIRLGQKQYEELAMLRQKEKDVEIAIKQLFTFALKLFNETEINPSNFDEMIELSQILSYYEPENNILQTRIRKSIESKEIQKDKAVVVRNFEFWNQLREEVNFLKTKI